MPRAERTSPRTAPRRRSARHDAPRGDVVFGAVLMARRQELGLSRRELAERAGLSYPFVSELERGTKSPSSTSMAALAAALELAPADLLRRAEIAPDGGAEVGPDLDDLASFVRRVVRDELAVRDQGDGPVDADDGSQTVEGRVEGPADMDGLRRQVLAAVRSFRGDDTEIDDEQDIPLRDRGVAVFVRVLDDPAGVLVFCPMLIGVAATAALHARLNEINAGVRFVRFSHVRGSVVADLELFAVPLVADHLELACRAVGSAAERFVAELHEQFGGELFVGDEPERAPAGPKPPTAGYL